MPSYWRGLDGVTSAVFSIGFFLLAESCDSFFLRGDTRCVSGLLRNSQSVDLEVFLDFFIRQKILYPKSRVLFIPMKWAFRLIPQLSLRPNHWLLQLRGSAPDLNRTLLHLLVSLFSPEVCCEILCHAQIAILIELDRNLSFFIHFLGVQKLIHIVHSIHVLQVLWQVLSHALLLIREL